MAIAPSALCVEDHAVGAHGGERQQIEKGLRGLFARGDRGIRADEMVGHCVGYGRVLKDPVGTHDGALGNPRRDENGGHADAETVKVEGVVQLSVGGAGGVAVRRAGRRRNMVEDAAMLVVDHQQRGAGPERGVRLDGVVDRGDIKLAGLDVVVRMLVGSQLLAVVVIVIAYSSAR